jgi:hypothetical protein
MIRVAILILASVALAPAWVESVEFPWESYPKPLWERELVWLKNAGISHVSLPPSQDAAQRDGAVQRDGVANRDEVLRIIRRLGMEADLEGPVPDDLQPLTRAHGGPLTEPLPGPPTRISALSTAAVTRSRELLISGAGALLWTDVEETLGASGYRPGAVNFAGEEKPATILLRRSAQLAAYWSATFPSLHVLPGASVTVPRTPAGPTPSVRQFAADNGASVISVVNKSARPWTGELRVFYPAAKREIGIREVTVPARDALWLPVNVPLTAGPLCKDCSAFGNADHLVYATDEMTAMEYENGILAMEFAAPSAGEVVLQLSREPSGPLVAGGRPTEFDWDEHTQRARLKIPAGTGPGKRMRIGIAIEPPDSTAFFDSARVLMIGETNRLTAQFSSEAIAQRSRLRLTPEFPSSQQSAEEPLGLVYEITVPGTAIHGDHADLAIEADGMQMSHARPELLLPVTLHFPDAIDVHLAANSALPLFPATLSVNQRAGRDLMIAVQNNAPEIRTFQLEPKVDGLEFSPAKLEVVVGASTSRDVSFRVFAKDAMPGLHAGSVTVTGGATSTEPIQFAVYPTSGAVAFSTSGFSLIESARFRASFLPGRWLEFIAKDNNLNLLANTGMPFATGVIETSGDALVLGDTRRTIRLSELEELAAKPKR